MLPLLPSPSPTPTQPVVYIELVFPITATIIMHLHLQIFYWSCCWRCCFAKMDHIELSQLQCMQAMRILRTANTTESSIWKNCSYSLVRFASPVCVCGIFFVDNFRNEFQLSVPLNTVPSVKMMADNAMQYLCAYNSKGELKKVMAEALSHIVSLEYFKAIPDRFNFTVSKAMCGMQFERGLHL